MTKYSRIDLKKIDEIKDNPSHVWQVYLAALEYINCGLYVIPIVKNGKQLPQKDYGVSYSSASKNKEKVEKWFHPEIGIFRGWNIGIATGKKLGVFAIDIDTHNDDGFETLALLEKENERLPLSPTQTTPNGGEHRLFEWRTHAINSTGKIGPGIDTRGGDDGHCKGHIVAWPSTVDGRQYKWATGGYPPEVPDWVMDRMGIAWKNNYASGRGNENVGTDDIEQLIPKAQIIRMLNTIDINSIEYDDWLKIGMSIKSQCPGIDGLDIWEDWSKNGTRYRAGECTSRWDGFSEEGTVRAGTLFYHAKHAGWSADFIHKDVHGNKYDEIVAEMNKAFCIVSVGGKIRILREKSLENNMSMHFDLMQKDDFKTLLSNEKVFIEDAKGVPKPIAISDIWLAHPARRTYAEGIGLYPVDPPEGYYNTWNGYASKPRRGDCDCFLDLILKVICAGDDKIYQWVLDWLADLIQFPDEPKGCCIVMRGEEGIGKGTFANTIGHLFGPHYKHLIDEKHLHGSFNAHLMDAIVVFADEITFGGNLKTSGKLKGMVTEKYLVGERKGIDALVYRNLIHMLIASNGKWVIPAGEKSRRWCVLDVDDTYANNVGYFNNINVKMNSGGKEALMYFLMDREITNNLRHAPVTKALQDQRSRTANHDTVLNWWVRVLAAEEILSPNEGQADLQAEDLQWPVWVKKISIYEEYEEWCLRKRQTPVALREFFTDFKRHSNAKEIRVSIKNKRVRLLEIPSIELAKKLLFNNHGDILGEY